MRLSVGSEDIQVLTEKENDICESGWATFDPHRGWRESLTVVHTKLSGRLPDLSLRLCAITQGMQKS